jgi:hypothetical protein
LGALRHPDIPAKRQVFISYHHHGDQAYKNALVGMYEGVYELLEDNSLDRAYDSDDLYYVEREIREDYIRGASATIVLCGALTHQRKFVDWEIYATLLKQAGLIGIQLPTLLPQSTANTVLVPDRLHDNIASGYALWHSWDELVRTAGILRTWVEVALMRDKRLIQNGRPKRQRNG